MSLAAVVIGRNEGERLLRCLASIRGGAAIIVYVDSGSTDDSVATARRFGADVIELDMSRPFTAARARNVGWRRTVELLPDTALVQFIDGDCELQPGWLESARSHMEQDAKCVAVVGRLRERFPDASVYNRLCDLEWDTPTGQVEACGGIACMRVAALESAGGFRDGMIAGEEPELSFRLRNQGGHITRIDREMATHDADMHKFRQWWKRAVRAGHAYAEAESLTRNDAVGLWRKEVRSIWIWSLILPILALGFVWPTRGWSLLVLLGYVALAAKIAVRHSRRMGIRAALSFALFCVIAKFAHLVGMMRFQVNHLLGRESRLIEHKPVATAVAGAPR